MQLAQRRDHARDHARAWASWQTFITASTRGRGSPTRRAPAFPHHVPPHLPLIAITIAPVSSLRAPVPIQALLLQVNRSGSGTHSQ